MVKIKIPATTSNFGSGFDCIGMAVNLYNYFTVEEQTEYEICSAHEIGVVLEHPVVKAMEYYYHIKGENGKKAKITIEGNIPTTCGLGSSATCYIAGIMAASFLSRHELSKEELIQMATELEGHPDNVAPAVLGGVQISIQEDFRVWTRTLKTPETLEWIAFVPEFQLSTKKARACLPQYYERKDSVYNLSRFGMLVWSFENQEYELLKKSVQDVLHQPYRGKLIPDYEEMVAWILKHCKYGGFISGAGATLIGIHNGNPLPKWEAEKWKCKWNTISLKVDAEGACIV